MSRSKQSSAAVSSSSRLVAGVVPSPADAQAALRTQLPELRSGQSVALLQELHILTREGKLNQDTRRKLKQVNHLLRDVQLLRGETSVAAREEHAYK